MVDGNKLQEERIDPARPLGPMRGIDQVGSGLYAFGMKRDMYRRLGNAKWERYNEGMGMILPKGKIDISALIKRGIKEMGGINSISEISTGEIYAFGMRGEIWTLRDDIWRKIDSPTNLTLTDSIALEDRNITACGNVGTVIEGYGNKWRVVQYSGPAKLDFCAIVRFKDITYLADGHSLRALKGNSLELVDFGVGDVVPSSSLHTTQRVFLSTAGKEVFLTKNGQVWNSLL
jgi:hypothetical protein